MTPVRKALLQIHFCVVLWGFTAILGKLISLPALPLVWWRMLIVVGALALWPPVWRALVSTDRRTLLVFAGIGVVVALPGVALVVGGTPAGMRAGIFVGALSALLVAVFGSLNKRYVERADPLLMTWVELAAGTAFLTAVAALWPTRDASFAWPDGRDFALLAALSIACTLLPFTLALSALRHTSAFTSQLAVSLEPVYAVALAIVLLGEQRELSARFYLGVALIIGAVFAHTAIKLRTAPS
jgi:drug/metabolite transporter (DMT)-like permease